MTNYIGYWQVGRMCNLGIKRYGPKKDGKHYFARFKMLNFNHNIKNKIKSSFSTHMKLYCSLLLLM